MFKQKLFDCLSKSFFKDELRQRDYSIQQSAREQLEFKRQSLNYADTAEVVNY